MSGSQYRYLFSPLQLGPVTVANRIVFAAHLTNYAEHGMPSEQHAAYYAARAAGGAGLIITEEHSVHPTDWPYEKMIHGFHHEVVPGLPPHHRGRPRPRRADLRPDQPQRRPGLEHVHPPAGVGPVAGGRPAVPRGAQGHRPRARSPRSWPATPTWRRAARTGGFDGIELQCSHSSIVRGFLSRATNHRTDEYGGSLENRARLLHEIVAAVREAIGRDLALGVRLCGDELIEHGITIDETVEVAQAVEDQGLVDYINTSIGVATASLFMIEASMHIPPEYAMFIPSALRKAVDLPVVGVGRFKDPLQAERALAQGHADLIGVVRGQIADAEFAAKARAGPPPRHPPVPVVQPGVRRAHGPQPLARLHREPAHRARGAAARPAAQAVALRPAAAQAGRSSSGRGRPGCRPAIAAARAGHRVTVLERDAEPGGQVRWAATVPNRAEFGDLVRNQVHECAAPRGRDPHRRRGDRRAGRRRSRPDAVVVATGSVPARPWWAPPPLDG